MVRVRKTTKTVFENSSRGGPSATFDQFLALDLTCAVAWQFPLFFRVGTSHSNVRYELFQLPFLDPFFLSRAPAWL